MYLVIGQQDAVVLYLFPYILDGRKRAPKRKRATAATLAETESPEGSLVKKSSLQERRESFLLHIQVNDFELFAIIFDNHGFNGVIHMILAN